MLDLRRLNRQRSDIVEILRACAEEPPPDDKEHPAIRMWRGNEQHLIQYGIAVCLEWQSRGNNDALLSKIMAFIAQFPDSTEPPEWLGDEAFHNAHKSYLKRLLPSWYDDYFPEIRDDLPLIWPRSDDKQAQVKSNKEQAKLIKKAHRLKKTAHDAALRALDAALTAGLNPETLEPLTDAERELYAMESE